MSALLVDAVVQDGRLRIVDEPFYLTRAERMAKKWGEGAALKIRIEPEEEAWRYADCKHYYGHLVAPVAGYTGETVPEVHLRCKALYMPDDGRTSITELNREEFKSYIEAVEQGIREELPEAWEHCCAAMALYERRTA